MRNTLYYGDNLQVLREHVPDESVDLVDPEAEFIDGKIYAVIVDGGEVAARRVFEAGQQLKLVTGDGHVDEYPRSRVNLIGRVRWSFREP